VFPGFVGCFTGMNDAGLTIASHEVFDPNTTALFNPKGVPFAMAYRRVLEECETVGAALKLLDGMERASVTSLVIADREGGAVIEVTPDTLAIRRFKDKPGVCTNHFCAQKNPNQPEKFATLDRFKKLTESVALKEGEVLSVEDVKKRLHEVRLVDSSKADLTIQTFVFEPAERKVHLRFKDGKGPATEGTLTTLDLNKLWGK
jgi:isopenicillin-N N-acyltransferase like protein